MCKNLDMGPRKKQALDSVRQDSDKGYIDSMVRLSRRVECQKWPWDC